MNHWISSEYDNYTLRVKTPINIGSEAFFDSSEDDVHIPMEVIHVIRRSDDIETYDNLSENILLDGEIKYDADASAEFITDKDCYLVWFKCT